MRFSLICAILLFSNSCKAQNSQLLKSEIISFFKIDDKEIKKCNKESEELRRQKIDEVTISTVQESCTARFEHFNFYRENTLKMLEAIPKEKDFIIINYISDNVIIPHTTKTILNFEDNYLGLKHSYNYENDKFIEKNEEFEISQSDIENIQKIEQYLKTGKSDYINNISAGLIGNDTHWYVIKKYNGKIKMTELFKVKK